MISEERVTGQLTLLISLSDLLQKTSISNRLWMLININLAFSTSLSNSTSLKSEAFVYHNRYTTCTHLFEILCSAAVQSTGET